MPPSHGRALPDYHFRCSARQKYRSPMTSSWEGAARDAITTTCCAFRRWMPWRRRKMYAHALLFDLPDDDDVFSSPSAPDEFPARDSKMPSMPTAPMPAGIPCRRCALCHKKENWPAESHARRPFRFYHRHLCLPIYLEQNAKRRVSVIYHRRKNSHATMMRAVIIFTCIIPPRHAACSCHCCRRDISQQRGRRYLALSPLYHAMPFDFSDHFPSIPRYYLLLYAGHR